MAGWIGYAIVVTYGSLDTDAFGRPPSAAIAELVLSLPALVVILGAPTTVVLLLLLLTTCRGMDRSGFRGFATATLPLAGVVLCWIMGDLSQLVMQTVVQVVFGLTLKPPPPTSERTATTEQEPPEDVE